MTDRGAPSATPATTWMARLPFFYGWVVVACTVALGFIGTSFYWLPSLFVIPMQEELGWSRSSLFLGLTVRGLVGAAVAPIFGHLYDRPHGARSISLITGLIAGASIIPLAWTTQEWQFLLLYGVLGGFAQVGQGVALTAALVPRWFVRKRGSAMATATIGSALAAFGVPFIIGPLIAFAGWRATWAIFGIIVIAVSAIPSLLLFRQPEDVGLVPDGSVSPPASRTHPRAPRDAISVTPGQALRDRRFWLLTIAIAAGSFPVSALPASLPTIFIDRGVPLELAMAGISIHGLSSLLSRFLWGWLANRLPARSILIGIGICGCVSTPLILMLSPSIVVMYAALISIWTGGFVMVNQLVWATYFGRAHLGAITGFVRPFQAIVSAVAPATIPLIWEVSGWYQPGIMLVAAAWALLSLGLLMIRERPRGDRAL